MGIDVRELYQFFSGAIMTGCLVVSLLFLGHWRRSRDRFFAYFSGAFFAFGLERLLVAFVQNPVMEGHAYLYFFRMFGFLLILFGILEKNRRTSG